MTIDLNQHNATKNERYCTLDNGFEWCGGSVAEFGQWHDRWFFLHNGIELVFSQDQYSALIMHSDETPDYLVLQFCLSGAIEVIAPIQFRSTQSTLVSANHSLLCYLPEPYQWRFPHINQVNQWVRIYCPTEFLLELQHSLSLHSPALQPCLNFTQPLIQAGVITPMMHLALQQMLQCPFQGMMQQLYLEGKVMELLALQLNQGQAAREREQAAALDNLPALRPDELDRLHQAKVILTEQFQNPPSLLTLARQVGLNDYKLKRGFRSIFGTTVWGYVQSLRLEQAKLLLQGTTLSMAEIAHQTGYSSASHFSDRFRREFGVTPSTYRDAIDKCLP